MIINRQNYQVWITDYFDGLLDEFQLGLLTDFLDKNPDIRSEFDEYPGLVMHPLQQDCYNASKLFRTAGELTNEQLEHLSVAFCENDLDTEQRREIAELKKTDPRFNESISTYEKIRFIPDDTVYPDKNMLFRIPEKRKRTRLIISSISVAASLTVLTGLFMIFSGRGGNNSHEQLAVYQQQQINKNNKTDKSFLTEPFQPRPELVKPGRDIPSAKPLALNETLVKEQKAEPPKSIISIRPLSFKKEISLDKTQNLFLLAQTDKYPEPLAPAVSEMSVKEYLSYQFRKQILAQKNPPAENLKAWEIADAGIRGFNKVLGWEMELTAEQDTEGRLKDIRFTSQLVKFDHKAKKSNGDL